LAKKALMPALRDAYVEEMTRDPRIILFGQDVVNSIFGDTRGLLDRFGEKRVRNTPISEAAMTSMAVGVAMTGRPVICHLMFSNFMYTGFDGIANQAARLRFMTGGQATLPVIFFAVIGGGTSSGAQHSDSPYPVYMNLGGIQVVVPATAADAKGLMKTALRGQNPVVFLVPKNRGGALGEIPEGDHVVPFGVAAIRRTGCDVSIVAIGSAVSYSMTAAAALEKQGIQAEIVDPRTLVPLDAATILASVARTGHLIIVDEARDSCSAASHIAAVVADKGFSSLKAPIRRITVPDTPLPYCPMLESTLVPNAEKIVVAAVDLLNQGRSKGMS
jgi:acetoin:2,6-dichlorophenolindophenol oxidoreductase subunit beta